MKSGMLIVVSAPAGCGKDTIVEKLFAENKSLRYSVSATTRNRREGEVDGTHYYFMSPEKFQELIKSGAFLEYTEYCGNFYGTPKIAVANALDAGWDVILKIEIEGANAVKELFPDLLTIFILPPSLEELRRRLEHRGTEDEATIERRIERARSEIANCGGYDYYVVNDDLEKAVEDIKDIIKLEKAAREN